VDHERETRSIAIATGGTGGHVYPALAVADTWRAVHPNIEIVFLGTAGGPEARLVPAHGYRFAPIPGTPLAGVGLGGKVWALGAVARGTAAARPVLRNSGAQLVLGFGGYASAGAVLGGRTLGLPTAIHEANAVAGIANRLLERFVDQMLLGFADVAHDYPELKTVVTGTPVRRQIGALANAVRPPLGDALHVLVAGGSGGSAFLNAHAPELLARVAARKIPLAVRHLAGEGFAAEVERRYAAVGVSAVVSDYADDMPEIYRHAQLAIACAGAGTLAELAIVGLPAVLVPLATAANDHQAQNARAYAALTGSHWVREEAWDADALAHEIVYLVTTPGALAEASERARLAARPEAARAIVDACEALLHA
jgi:UDP-N-acetylglucosamine--N-acetylmuramyl-(pentapeptide) pyrophosphoryl-undecaprenol N-acetylglucosamine transferase